MNVTAGRLTTWLSTTLADLGVDGEPVITRQSGDATVLDVSIGRGDQCRRFVLTVEAADARLAVIHLGECEPDGKCWQKTTYRDAIEAGGTLCQPTRYMENELFPDEPVWLERAPRTGDHDPHDARS